MGSLDKTSKNVGTGLVGAPACGDVMKLQVPLVFVFNGNDSNPFAHPVLLCLQSICMHSFPLGLYLDSCEMMGWFKVISY